jgi:ubiquinol-cytochrome c reductase iron-sulfur subunit
MDDSAQRGYLSAERVARCVAFYAILPADRGNQARRCLLSHAEEHNEERRDFLFYATAGTGAVVTGAAVWPLVNQMNPSADVLALSSIRVDVSSIEPGTQLTVKWLGKPVFIRHRTGAEIAEAQKQDEEAGGDFPDNNARNVNLDDENAPATDANRVIPSPEGEAAGAWIVQMGVCTHLGCVPLGDAGDFGGWFCPCHGSHYDLSGRIRKGPAPENLPVPPVSWVDESTIQLG